ncbi:MAG: hypothetical protein Tsb002_17400 [Wenzhouxiangellaceae bacterium]
MAIVKCPACGQRVSNVHQQCPQCHADMTAADAGPLNRRRNLRQALYRARMGGYAALTVMVLAVLIWWIPSEGILRPPAAWLRIAFALGAVGYLVSRYFLFTAKRGLRSLDD